MKAQDQKKANTICTYLKDLPTGVIVGIYGFLREIIKVRIEKGEINMRQLQELAEAPIIPDGMRNEILR
jgi:hypothetical protein